MVTSAVRHAFAATSAALAAALLVPSAQADAVSDFYKGKSLRLISASNPGGGYDTYARLVARHFGSHVPGKPDVVVQAMPGAGGLTATNFLYNRAPRDGSYIGAPQRGVFFEPIYGQFANQAQFDPFKFTWLGSLVSEVSVMIARSDAPIKTFKESFEKEAIVGATRSDMETFVVASQNMLGTKFRIVSGYPGSADVVLALSRGEVQILANVSWAPFRARYTKEIKEGEFVPLVQFALRKHPELPHVPVITEFARNDEERQVLEMIYARQTVGRPYLAPPEVPADRAKALRQAFMNMTKDAKFLGEAKKSRLEVAPVYADEVDELLRKVASASPAIIARTKAAVSNTRMVKMAELKTTSVKIAGMGKKGQVQFTGADGKKMRGRVTNDTEITIAGKKEKSKSLREGLACKVAWTGDGGTVVKLDCD